MGADPPHQLVGPHPGQQRIEPLVLTKQNLKDSLQFSLSTIEDKGKFVDRPRTTDCACQISPFFGQQAKVLQITRTGRMKKGPDEHLPTVSKFTPSSGEVSACARFLSSVCLSAICVSCADSCFAERIAGLTSLLQDCWIYGGRDRVRKSSELDRWISFLSLTTNTPLRWTPRTTSPMTKHICVVAFQISRALAQK